MLVQRRKQRGNVKTALGQHLIFAGNGVTRLIVHRHTRGGVISKLTDRQRGTEWLDLLLLLVFHS